VIVFRSQHDPEPYFVIGGKERSGWRNAFAAARAAHPGAELTQDRDRSAVLVRERGGSGWLWHHGSWTLESGPRCQTRLRLGRNEVKP